MAAAALSAVDYDLLAGRQKQPEPSVAGSGGTVPSDPPLTLLNDDELKYVQDRKAKEQLALDALRTPCKAHVNAAGDTRVKRIEDPIDTFTPATPSQALAAIACRLNDDSRFNHPDQLKWLEYARLFAPSAIRADDMVTREGRMACIASVRTENYRIAAVARKANATLQEVAVLKTVGIKGIEEAVYLVPSLERFRGASQQLQQLLDGMNDDVSWATEMEEEGVAE